MSGNAVITPLPHFGRRHLDRHGVIDRNTDPCNYREQIQLAVRLVADGDGAHW